MYISLYIVSVNGLCIEALRHLSHIYLNDFGRS